MKNAVFEKQTMHTTGVDAQINCVRCGRILQLKKKRTKTYRRGLCRKKCDGILRNFGGWPVNPMLRAIYKNRNNTKTQTKAKISAFYASKEWRFLRYDALKKYGRKCVVCGSMPPTIVLHVDHIKPLSKFPELRLDINNLQIMCEDCNIGKSNRDSINWTS